MKTVPFVATLTLMTGFTFGQAATSPTVPSESGPESKAVQEAAALLEEAAQAYADAPTLRDQVTVEFVTPDGPQTQSFELAFGRGKDAYFHWGALKATALDGHVYIEDASIADSYSHAELVDDIGTTLALLFGNHGGVLPVHFSLRAEKGLEEYIRSITLGAVPDAKLAGHSVTTNESGKSIHEISLVGPRGESATVHIDPRTKLIRNQTVTYSPPGAPPEITITARISMNPVVADVLDEPIRFDPGDRKRVEATIPVGIGRRAPDFSLPTLDGRTVTLSDVRGSVVVLDFWATWCGPCRLALPKLQEFATWAEASGKPVRVFAVDCSERFGSREKIQEKVGEFWKGKSYSMTTLMDYDNAVWNKFGLRVLPTTVVIASDGTITNIHTGFDPNLVETLRNDVTKCLAADE